MVVRLHLNANMQKGVINYMTPYEKAVIAERLTSLREERGLAREQVANEMGLALSTIAGYEQAYRTPKFNNLSKLAKFYRVSLEYLTGQEEQGVTVQETEVTDVVLTDFILKVQKLYEGVDLTSREKREELDLILDILEMRIKKKLQSS